MSKFDDAKEAFRHSLARANEMVKLHDALKILGAEEASGDALRAAWVLAVSSFDFFLHEVVCIEASYRYQNSTLTRSISLPLEILIIQNESDRLSALEGEIRRQNSYKAFVAPDKVAEILSAFCKNPWSKISAQYKELHGEEKKEVTLKTELKNIWQRRNKIAHEADINPDLSGVTLWPVYKEDAMFTLGFLDKLGMCIPSVIVIADLEH